MLKYMKRRAFTLLELIVVIVVLGVIAGLAVPTFLSVTTKSREQVALNEAKAFARDVKALAAFTITADASAWTDEADAETAGSYATNVYTATNGCTVEVTPTGDDVVVGAVSCDGAAPATTTTVPQAGLSNDGTGALALAMAVPSGSFMTIGPRETFTATEGLVVVSGPDGAFLTSALTYNASSNLWESSIALPAGTPTGTWYVSEVTWNDMPGTSSMSFFRSLSTESMKCAPYGELATLQACGTTDPSALGVNFTVTQAVPAETVPASLSIASVPTTHVIGNQLTVTVEYSSVTANPWAEGTNAPAYAAIELFAADSSVEVTCYGNPTSSVSIGATSTVTFSCETSLAAATLTNSTQYVGIIAIADKWGREAKLVFGSWVGPYGDQFEINTATAPSITMSMP